MLTVINNTTMRPVATVIDMAPALAWLETIPAVNDGSIIAHKFDDFGGYGIKDLFRLYKNMGGSVDENWNRVIVIPKIIVALDHPRNPFLTSEVPPDAKRVARIQPNEETVMTKKKASTSKKVLAAKKVAPIKAPAKTAPVRKSKARKVPTAPKPASDKTAPIKVSNRVRQNGMLHPKPNTSGGRVWAIADDLAKKAGGPPSRKDVVAECVKQGLSEEGSSGYYQDWRRFHGLTKKRVADEELKLLAKA